MCRVGRNISDDVFALSNEFPPYIPRYPPTLGEKMLEGKVTLGAGFFGFVVNGNDFNKVRKGYCWKVIILRLINFLVMWVGQSKCFGIKFCVVC